MGCRRKIDYLRISVTDRCNLRCMYCMPKEGVPLKSHEEMLTFEEIVRLVRIFASRGIRKIRITGGEPLVRKGVVGLVRALASIDGIEEISLTTNGILLSYYANDLKAAGVKKINISLDTLKEENYEKITRSNSFAAVREGIDSAKQAAFDSIKLNVVIMKGINDSEIVDFVKFASERDVVIRFIEFMEVTPLWKEDLCFPIEKVKEICRSSFGLEKIEFKSFGPAEYYRSKNCTIGFIKTLESNCRVCSRLRLTSTGEIKSCLYEPTGLSMRDLLQKDIDDAELGDIIQSLIDGKEEIDFTRWSRPATTYMCSLGG